MNYIKLAFTAIFFSLAVSPAYSSDNPTISSEFIDSYCSEHFAMVNVEFTNETTKWMELTELNIDFGDEATNDQIKILAGNKLIAWNQAAELRNTRSNIKTGLLLGALGIVASSGINQNNNSGSTLAKLSGLTAAGILTAKTIEGIEESYRGTVFPENHLFSGVILVPPGLSVNRWIVFNTENGRNDKFITKANLTYKIGGAVQQKKLDLMRYPHLNTCVWQKSLAPRSSDDEF